MCDFPVNGDFRAPVAVFAFGGEAGGVAAFDNVKRTRFVGVEQGQSRAEAVGFKFRADFFLFGNIGFERFAGIADGVGPAVDGGSRACGRALSQAFDVVAVHRPIRRDAVHRADGGTEARFFVIFGLSARIIGVSLVMHLLPARPEHELQAFVPKAEGVAQGEAGQACFAGNGRIAHVVARIQRVGGCGLRIAGRVVEVGRILVAPIHDVSVFARGLETVGGGGPFVPYRARIEFAAQTDFARVDFILTCVVEAVNRSVAIDIADSQVCQRIVFLAAAEAIGGVGSQVVVEIVFAAHCAEPVALVGIRPRLRPVGRGIRRGRHGGQA